MPHRYRATIGGLGAFVATSLAILLHAGTSGAGPFA
jgi:hypothetical protein